MRYFTRLAPFLAAVAVTEASGVLEESDMHFLEDIARAVVDASRVRPGEYVGEIGPNTTGGILIRPGGRSSYPAFWIRDYAMSLESGFVTADEQRHMILLTAAHQSDTEWVLPSGSIVTPGSIPDHVTFDGKPIFYPGTLDDYEGQGGPRWGKLPSLDDAFFFIHMLSHYLETSGDVKFLDTLVNGKSLMQRAEQAYAMPPSDPRTGIVCVNESNRGISFGFFDTIIHTGDLFFCSLLKWRASRELAEMFERTGDNTMSTVYHQRAETLIKAVRETFSLQNGMFRATTGMSAQPDVWGTAFGVYVGAFPLEQERAASQALAKAYRAGALAWQGNIRHVSTTDDFSSSTAWENTDIPKNRYQNGAYWGTPVGWVCFAIAKTDLDAAQRLAREYIAELREGDFRKGPEFGSPWECMHPDGDYRQNAVYMTSVTCPFAAFRRMERKVGAQVNQTLR